MTEPPTTTDERLVTIRLFAAASERAGTETVTVRVSSAARVGNLRDALGEAVPQLRTLTPHLLFAIGTRYAADRDAVPASGEIVAFPPVSGG